MEDMELPELPEPLDDLVSAEMRKQIREYARRAALMERERCAALVDELARNLWMEDSGGRVADQCAAAIRKGSQ